jgi:Sec-independent protein translocase protein TatA
MKTAGKAFTTGMFGTLGVGAAILGTVGIVVLVGERKLKKLFREFEETMRERTEDLLREAGE